MKNQNNLQLLYNSVTLAEHRKLHGVNLEQKYQVSALDWCTKKSKEIAKLLDVIEDLVGIYKYSNFHDMSDCDKKCIIGHLLAAMDDPDETLPEFKNYKTLIGKDLSSYMITLYSEQRDEFLSNLLQDAISYFGNALNVLVESKCAQYEETYTRRYA